MDAYIPEGIFIACLGAGLIITPLASLLFALANDYDPADEEYHGNRAEDIRLHRASVACRWTFFAILLYSIAAVFLPSLWPYS